MWQTCKSLERTNSKNIQFPYNSLLLYQISVCCPRVSKIKLLTTFGSTRNKNHGKGKPNSTDGLHRSMPKGQQYNS